MGIFDKAIDRLAVAITKASPTATPIESWQMNQQNQYGNSVGLPRESNLGNVPFAPGVPIIPGAINPVRADGRPDPRRYEFQVAQNINITETRLVPFKTLRAAADQIDILRRCVEVIKQKMVGLDWDIVLGDDAIEKVMAETGEKSNIRAMQIAKDKYSNEINRMRQFWEQPDVSNGLVFADWLNMALEEVLVLDAWAVWPQATVGGDVKGLQILDGSTIKPLIDDRGMRPEAPFAAFQQILYGFPRSEFSAPVESEDADGEFASDELQYMVRNRRTNTVYGYSPVERALSVADIYLRRQQWLRAEYTDGVMPELLFESNADFGNNPDLLKAYENVFNDDLAGQTEQRKRARILPTGLKAVQYEGYGEKFKDVLDEYLVNSICGHFGVLPTEIGFSPKGGLGGSGHQAGQAESSEVIGVLPLANWTARMLSNLSYVFLGMPRELEFKFQPSGRTDAAGIAAEMDIKRKNGGLTLNEARSREGLPLIEAPEADQPMIVTPAGVFFVTDDGLVPIADPASEPAPDISAEPSGEVPPESETPEESDVENGAPQSDDEAKKALGAWSASNLVSGEITKFDPNQPRDPKGRFGSGIGSLASQAENGFSVRAVDFKTPTRGYMVARPEGGVVIDAPDLESTKQGLKDFMEQNKQRFADDPTLYIGGWKDSNTGKLYLDLSDNVASKRIASELGTRRDQLAVWDVVNSREIGTGGTGGANAEPGTSTNPDQLYGAGTVIRKGAFGLLRVVSGGTGFSSGNDSEGITGSVETDLDKYDSSQVRDAKGRWALSGAIKALASDVASRASMVEPRISADMKGLADKHGVELAGFQFRLKSESSLARKINSDAKNSFDGNIELAAQNISDSVRYTVLTDSKNYTAKTQAIITDLQAQGYTMRVKNYWTEGSNYKGVNVALVSAEGQKVELQFHTPESFHVKEGLNHPIYEKYRTLAPSHKSKVARALNAEMVANCDTLTAPPKVETVGELKVGKMVNLNGKSETQGRLQE